MNTHTYYLDQNLRGKISKGKINTTFLRNKYYQKPAILPVALLEYAGIKGIKTLIREIIIPQSLIDKNPLELHKIKEHLENELRNKLPKKHIEERLKDRVKNDNNLSQDFAQECIRSLSNIYNILIAQLSWDRFSQMKWDKYISNNNILGQIRIEICKLISKENLPVLRHCANHLLKKTSFADTDNEDTDLNYLMEIIKKTKVEHDKDIGDCEFIHAAINGQSLADHKQRVAVDCYTMDPVKEIKRRLILCSDFYGTLEYVSSQYDFQYKFNPKYCGRIYIIDEQGNVKEKIDVKDYFPINKVLLRIKLQYLKKKEELRSTELLSNIRAQSIPFRL